MIALHIYSAFSLPSDLPVLTRSDAHTLLNHICPKRQLVPVSTGSHSDGRVEADTFWSRHLDVITSLKEGSGHKEVRLFLLTLMKNVVVRIVQK